MGSEPGDSNQITGNDATSEQQAGKSMEQPVSLLTAQPSFSYMQAMAGFMGVVEAPKTEDPAVLAAAALEFLDVMWEVCEVRGDASSPTSLTQASVTCVQILQEQEHDPEADAAGQHGTNYEETARNLAGQVHVSTVTGG